MSRFFSFALPVLAALCVGCASNYQLGTTLPPALRDVYVPSVVNQTTEPTIHQIASQSLLAEIQRDGTLNLLSEEEEARVILEVSIINFEMKAIAYQENDKHTGREYRATVTAHVSFRDRSNGRVLLSNNIIGETDFELVSDLTSAKRRMMPIVCKKLSENIVDACISIW